jgi:hypothetical protein
MTTRQQRCALRVKELNKTGVSKMDPGRVIRMALLDLEYMELQDLQKGIKRPESYYDMSMPLMDSPSQHSTPCTPIPFTPSPSPLVATEGYYMQYPLSTPK